MILFLIDLLGRKENEGIKKANIAFPIIWYYGLFYFFFVSFMRLNLTVMISTFSSIESMFSLFDSGGLSGGLGIGYWAVMLFTVAEMVMRREQMNARELCTLSLAVLLFLTSLMPWIDVKLNLFFSTASLKVSLLDIGTISIGVLTSRLVDSAQAFIGFLVLSLLILVPVSQASLIDAIVAGKDRKSGKTLNMISITGIILSVLFILAVKLLDLSMEENLVSALRFSVGSGAVLALIISVIALLLLKVMLNRVKRDQPVSRVFLKILDPESVVVFKQNNICPAEPLFEYGDLELKS